MASYLAEIRELFRADANLRFFATARERKDSPGDMNRVHEILGVPVCSKHRALILPWDLVIMADQPFGFRRLAEPWRHPVLRIPHGIGGKIVRGVDYQYGCGVRDVRGRLVFTRFFESGFARRDAVVRLNPELAGRIAVVGNPRLDQIRAAAARRNVVRAAWGVRDDRIVVLFTGSWGPDSLLPKWGDALFASARQLRDQHVFVVRPHPNLLRRDGRNNRDWAATLQAETAAGIKISPSSEPLKDALAACDLVIGDDLSSVTLFAAIVGKPVVVFPSGSGAVGQGTFLDTLTRLVPVIDNPARLGEFIKVALDQWPPPGLDAWVSEIDPLPGKSAGLIRREIFDLLGLEGPPDA